MIGIDIVKISRVEKLIEKFGYKALDRFLTQNEQNILKSPSSIAGFWAAKEAFSKAIGTGIGKECSFLDIEILKNEKGKPYFSPKTIQKFNLKKADLSISHDGGFAIAAVIILR
ncbi:holo-ACP synthase [Caminibacter mediatlanticus TB-2]|uniref:Holo-[acyl-carrier-protein] synthase n=1 Tax=Caminibacter mediatlanticus TB-2 TaxID=391592 RepID=A0AAI9AHM0_9BACT|nr:holo-ACP synthase [Caminibacter mediatlanticus]EDM23803.1 Phosphopantethiene-protein transferase [Caminibacter mediatlanticus TB-2]QCT94689.1 holo-ACP synthase [Caminibacter mediatlanticus TB-2]